MNSLNVILPYKWEGLWVFNDVRVGLDKEPFVSGADTIMELLAAGLPEAENGFRLLFSATPFPGHQLAVDWRRGEYGGNWYYSPAHDLEGWLCPALMKYFEEVPARIFVQTTARA